MVTKVPVSHEKSNFPHTYFNAKILKGLLYVYQMVAKLV